MFNFWLFSDLHQEWPENAWDPQANAPSNVDAVVAAGDVDMPLVRAIDWLADRFSGRPIIYTPGNHDFWRRDEDRYSLQDQLAWGRDRADARGVTLLLDDSVEIGGVRFVGGTLWTDFNLRPPYYPFGGAVAEAGKRMNDYRRIRFGGNRSKDRLEPRDTLAMHRATRAFIDGALASPFAGASVVVTHHAPHPDCLPSRDFDLAWCYASDMTTLIEERHPDVWVHGHLHGRLDFRVAGTRIVMNSRGHAHEPSKVTFDPALVISV